MVWINRSQRQPFAGYSESHKQVLRELFGSNTSATGEHLTSDKVFALPSLYHGIKLVAGTIGRVPCHFAEKTEDQGRVRRTDDSRHRLLNYKATNHQTSSQWLRTMVSNAYWSGNGISAIEWDAAYRPVAFHVLDSRNVQIAYEYEGHKLINVWYVHQNEDGTQSIFPSEDIIHFRNYGLHRGMEGVSVCDQFKDVLGLARAVVRYGAIYFKNGTSVSRYLKIPNWPNQDQEAQLREDLKNFEGLDNAHRIMTLKGGTELGALPISNEDAQWLASREASLTDIANIVGIPVSKIGGRGYVSYSSLEQDALNILGDCYEHWFSHIEDELNLKLVGDRQHEKLYFEFERKALFKSDPAQVRLIIDQFNNRMLTHEECRELLGRDVNSEGTYVDNFGGGEDKANLAASPPPLATTTTETPTETKPQEEAIERAGTPDTGEDMFAHRLLEMIKANLDRIKTRLTKATKQETFDLAEHEEVIRRSLPGVDKELVDMTIDELMEELEAVLPEQREDVIDRWDTTKIANKMLRL